MGIDYRGADSKAFHQDLLSHLGIRAEREERRRSATEQRVRLRIGLGGLEVKTFS